MANDVTLRIPYRFALIATYFTMLGEDTQIVGQRYVMPGAHSHISYLNR